MADEVNLRKERKDKYAFWETQPVAQFEGGASGEDGSSAVAELKDAPREVRGGWAPGAGAWGRGGTRTDDCARGGLRAGWPHRCHQDAGGRQAGALQLACKVGGC